MATWPHFSLVNLNLISVMSLLHWEFQSVVEKEQGCDVWKHISLNCIHWKYHSFSKSKLECIIILIGYVSKLAIWKTWIKLHLLGKEFFFKLYFKTINEILKRSFVQLIWWIFIGSFYSFSPFFRVWVFFLVLQHKLPVMAYQNFFPKHCMELEVSCLFSLISKADLSKCTSHHAFYRRSKKAFRAITKWSDSQGRW